MQISTNIHSVDALKKAHMVLEQNGYSEILKYVSGYVGMAIWAVEFSNVGTK